MHYASLSCFPTVLLPTDWHLGLIVIPALDCSSLCKTVLSYTCIFAHLVFVWFLPPLNFLIIWQDLAFVKFRSVLRFGFWSFLMFSTSKDCSDFWFCFQQHCSPPTLPCKNFQVLDSLSLIIVHSLQHRLFEIYCLHKTNWLHFHRFL